MFSCADNDDLSGHLLSARGKTAEPGIAGQDLSLLFQQGCQPSSPNDLTKNKYMVATNKWQAQAHQN